MGRGWTNRIRSRDWPWFSSLKWWQKVLFGLAAFVVFMTLFLLPHNFSLYLVASGLVSTFALSYVSLKGWQRIMSIGFFTAALTALMLLTEHFAPYGVVVMGVVALLLSFLTGWRDSGPQPPDRTA